VALGHEFKLKVVAEGVEDLPTWRALNTIGCDIGQGYYFSAALSEPGFTAWHDGWDRRPRFEAAA
jgi:EAL domain-containing protein (putative c-di-GMP-specific phosphodiesterase class I)